MNYFELYPGDYQRDTGALSLAQHGAFVLLLMTYYATETAIPNDNPTLFRIARAMTEEERDAVVSVADKFFPVSVSDGLRHNERADLDIAKYRIRVESARANGKRGGRPTKPSNNPTLYIPVNPIETQPVTQEVTGKKALHAPLAITKDIPPATAAGSAPDKKKSGAVEITTWLASLGDADAIPADDPIYTYAEQVGIPDAFLLLSWHSFREAYTSSKKKQSDFPKTYRNAVKGNWYKLWWFTPEGECKLTTPGEQARRAAEAQA